MNDFIINVLQAHGPVIPTCVPLIGGLPYNSPLTGSFLGVVFGFAVSTVWKWVGDKRSGLHHIKLVKSELNQARVILNTDKNDGSFINPMKERLPNTLPNDCWTSAVNNGDLRLFSSNEVDYLSKIYSQIKAYNDEMQIYISLLLEYGIPINDNIPEDFVYYPQRKRLGELNIGLIDRIGVLMEKEWMSSKHWWQRIRP